MSAGSRRLIAILVVLLVGAAVPVYFFLVEPGITKTEYAAELISGPGSGEVSHYHWFGVFDEYTTRRPFQDREVEPLQLVVMLVALSDSPEGTRFTSGGGGGHKSDGDGLDFHYHLHINGTIPVEIGMDDDWTKLPEAPEGMRIEGEGDRKQFVIGGKTYDLTQGRVFLLDRAGRIHQLNWAPTDATAQAIDEQVRDMLSQRGDLP
jgi:hypothetical protein